MAAKIINYTEFLRSFAIRPDGAMSFFLGSGASAQAGIPTGSALTWEFKRKLYCGFRKVREEKFKDLETERNKQIIQSYFDAQKDFPPLYSSGEYSFYFERCYPNSIDRKFFIQSKVSNIHPSIGHKCLGAMIASKKVDYVWTTNFDELIENGTKAITPGLSYEVISPDNAHQVENLNSSYPKIIKLHGDFRYDRLQNTTQETQELDEQLRNELTKVNSNKGLIVIGYSGNDNSIMNSMSGSLQYGQAFPYGLIWCIRKGEEPNKKLVELIDEVDKKNNLSGFLEIESFDEFLYELYCACNLKNSEIEGLAENLFHKRKPFTALQADQSIEPIKLNALVAKDYPRSIYAFDSDLRNWKELKALIKGSNLVGALCKGKTYAFGDIEEIRRVFGKRIKSEVTFDDVKSSWLYINDSFYFGMLYDLIDLNLTAKYGIEKVDMGYKSRKYFRKADPVTCKNQPTYYNVYEAFEYQFTFHDKELFLLVFPTVHIVDSRDPQELSENQKSYSKFEKQKIANSIISNRRNKDVNNKLDFWLRVLKGENETIHFNLSDFKIELSSVFAYAGFKTTDKAHFFQRLFTLEEQKLAFSVSDSSYKSAHPLKGLKAYSPLDCSFDNRNVSQPVIKLSIISPASGFDRLINHLNGLKGSFQNKSEKEYLVEYSGFDPIYRKFIEIPSNNDNKLCVLINEDEISNKNQIGFYNVIKRKIDYFSTLKGEFDVLVIYFPERWKKFRELKNDAIYFDLHDSVKIYCAKKNIKIQFIEDKSIDYFDQVKVKWWLSLGLYVKANGIPWRSQSADDSTAYIGLGFALKGGSNKDKVVMGCSQVFDSTGQGLRFLLQPVERPIYYGKNPFMSKADARRVIAKLKEAYFRMDPNSKLEKLVIHKTTHYTREEMEGIAQALDGIPKIELLQIQRLSFWRGIRGDRVKKLPHNFPIIRGTALQLDDFSFLLWTHGSVLDKEIAGKLNYYQGGRGIPAPLLVRRFRGQDSIETTMKEILMLTKMNWNGGELYKTLPVTLDFSKKLSKMAKQEESLQCIPYDFRFFM